MEDVRRIFKLYTERLKNYCNNCSAEERAQEERERNKRYMMSLLVIT